MFVAACGAGIDVEVRQASTRSCPVQVTRRVKSSRRQFASTASTNELCYSIRASTSAVGSIGVNLKPPFGEGADGHDTTQMLCASADVSCVCARA